MPNIARPQIKFVALTGYRVLFKKIQRMPQHIHAKNITPPQKTTKNNKVF